jgi:hypothetical protein
MRSQGRYANRDHGDVADAQSISRPSRDGTPWHLLTLRAMLAKAARMVASRKGSAIAHALAAQYQENSKQEEIQLMT